MLNRSTSCAGVTRLSHTERLLWSVTALACASIMRGSRTPEGLRLAGQSHSLEQASGCENECEFPWRNDSMPPARELLCALSDPKERAGPPPAGGPSIARLLGQEARDWRASSGRRRATGAPPRAGGARLNCMLFARKAIVKPHTRKCDFQSFSLLVIPIVK